MIVSIEKFLEKLLCKFISHEKMICYDGLTHGLIEVCARKNCNHRKHIKSTKKNEIKYQQQLKKGRRNA